MSLLFFSGSPVEGRVPVEPGLAPSAAAIQETADFSLHVKDVPLSAVLRSLAELTHQNMIFSGNLEGTVTADLVHVTPKEALEILLDTKGLVAKKRGNTLIIFGGSEKEKMGKAVASYRLSYADAKEVAKGLTGLLGESHISYSPGANTVMVSGTPTEVMQMEDVIRHLDVPEKQVKVEAEVLAVNRAYAKDLGIDWDFDSLTGSAKYHSAGDKSSKNRGNHIESVEIPTGYAGISYGRSITGHPYTAFFRAKLNALVSEGKAKILARPHVVTMNGREAEILIGNKIPVLVERLDNGVRTTTTEYRDAGIKLSYTPRVNDHDEITADVSAEVSTPYLIPEMKAYRIITRQANTLVRLRSGDSLTIGGLIDKEENKIHRKVPLLGDIPLLGKLFQSESDSVEESEIIIIIKADIIDGGKEKEPKKTWRY